MILNVIHCMGWIQQHMLKYASKLFLALFLCLYVALVFYVLLLELFASLLGHT